MSNPESSDGLTASESSLGKALALIHRVLPLLQQPERALDVQRALRNTANLIESARQSHAAECRLNPPAAVGVEMAAIVASAIAVMLDCPHRVISVVPVETSWAAQGRSQLLVSHKVR
jgi:hypothetical protein